MPPATETAGPRILIVDDQPSNVRLLEHTLRRAGYANVISTVNPCEVIALHQQHRFDLILLDLQMPEMSGFQVMAALQPERGACPVSILVLSADASQMANALAGGADSFIGKPFRLPDVVERVQLMLKTPGAPVLVESAPPAPPAREEHRAATPQGLAAKVALG